MSLQTRLSDFITRVGTEFKAFRTIITGTSTGAFTGLATTSQNVIGAINEVRTTANASAVINDTTASTTSVYSSTKTDAQVATAVAALVASSPAALDTLNEFALALGNDANYAATTAAAIGLKANSADVWTKTEIGLVETDLVALFNAALA